MAKGRIPASCAPTARAVNAAPFQILVCLLITAVVVAAAVNEYATNKYLNVGYTPDQPVAFDHSFHAGPDSVLGLDCRYCHNSVDKSAHSNVPATNTCWNCHSQVKPDSPALARIAEVTGGVPRSINVLCDMALVYGFGGDQPIIDVALVDQVLADRRDFGVLGGLSTRQ